MNDLNLGMGGSYGTPTTGSIFTPPETQVEGTLSAEVVNGQIKDSTSTGVPATGLQIKGLFVSLPNSPKLNPPNEALVDEKLSLIPPNLQALVLGKPIGDTAVKAPVTPIVKPLVQPKITADSAQMETDVAPDVLSSTFDTEFLALLQNQTPPLAQVEIAKLTSLHYNPETKFAGSTNPKLLSKFQNLEQEAASNAAVKLGIPLRADGTSPVSMKADSESYNAKLDSGYQENLKNATTAFLASEGSKEWSVDDKKWLAELLTNPETNAPIYVKTAANQIINTAVNQLIANQNLGGVGYVPQAIAPLAPANVALTNYFNTAQAILDEASSVASKIKDPSLKAHYMEILALISEALKEFQENSHVTGTMSDENKQKGIAARLDANLNKIKENGKAALDAKNQAAKFANMGPIGKLIMLIVAIIMIIISVFLTVLTLGMAAPLTVNLIMGAIAMTVVADKGRKEDSDLAMYKEDFGKATDDLLEGAVEDSVKKNLKSDAANKSIKETTDYMAEIQKAADDISNSVNSAGEATPGAVPPENMSDNLIKIHLAIMKANKDGESTLSEDNLLVLKKLLEQLLALLAGGGDISAFMGELNTQPTV